MNDLNLAVLGNCSFSALVDKNARIVWSCLPRYDGDPVFCSLMNGGKGDEGDGDEARGYFSIEIEDFARSEQYYRHNTAILVTLLYDSRGSAVEITDFAPRFKQLGRVYRPVMIVRQLRPVIGAPRIRVRLRPGADYGRASPETTHGSNHIRYLTPSMPLRLTTDLPLSYLLEEVPFVLETDGTLMLGPDETFDRPISHAGREFHENTAEYWRDWCRYLSIPFEWQEAVIRAAITLKLCSFEETGAIVAAMTTSIPEAPDSGRNWDYRFCWLRDAYFVVHALNRLGATRTMEEYMRYITNVAATAENGHLQPVYGITQQRSLLEREETHLSGYRGMGPVRVGNQAYEHIQNDVYGSVILATAQMFFDERLERQGDLRIFDRLEHIGKQALAVFDKPDAGLWEYRTIARVHTFSAVMCWAACDRLAKIADRMGLALRAGEWRDSADRIHRTVCDTAWNPTLNSFVDSMGDNGERADASLLLLHHLGFLKADDPRFAGTVALVEKRLKRGNFIFRYDTPDDFGAPETAFTVCTFWYIDALNALGRDDEARALFEYVLAHRNHVGLLSEDMHPETGELWGNFPQTYSMVGLILNAMDLSSSWEDAF